MKKRAQSIYGDGVAGKNLYDLYRAIERDVTLNHAERLRLINQVQGLTGHASGATPLSVLMTRGLGGVVGYLISKYFGMSPVGQVVSTALGLGLGRMVYDQFNKPKPPNLPGWKLL